MDSVTPSSGTSREHTGANVRILRTMHRYLRHRVSAEDAARFLAAVGLDESFLRNENNWVSYDVYLRAWAILQQQSGDPSIAFKVGSFNISPENLGSLWWLLRAAAMLGNGTAAGYRIVPRVANQLASSGRFELLSLGRRSARLRWIQHQGYRFAPAQCDYRIGLLTAGPKLGALPPAIVDQQRCIGRGDPECLYDVRFSADRAVMGRRLGIAVGLAGGVTAVLAGQGWLVAGLGATTALAVGWARDRQSQFQYNSSTLSSQMEELIDAKRRLQEDYTALQDAQQLLREKDRLASLGELSAKVAHELRNPLGIIKGSAQIIADSDRPLAVREEMTSFILEEVDRMNAAITNFLVFARPKTSHRTATALEGIVERLLLEWEARGPGGIHVRFDAEPELPRVLVDPHQLHQVLLNLLLNAQEAMGASGAIEITTRRAGNAIALRVDDRGPGFSDEARQRAFEAFFTTKDFGTGLGLTNVKQMVEANGGAVRLGTSPSGGGRVELTFEATSGGGSQPRRPSGGGEEEGGSHRRFDWHCRCVPGRVPMARSDERTTLLIVDDDARYVTVLGHLLADLAEIDSCGDARSAMALLRTRRFDWLLLDVLLPDANGFDLLAAIVRLPYAPKVVLHSGAVLADGRGRAIAAGAVDLLEKPLQVGFLAELLRDSHPAPSPGRR
jgi:signal transduction histidine kinase/CheY-like chemotaxis protein